MLPTFRKLRRATPDAPQTLHPRACLAANGDLLVFVASGNIHYASRALDTSGPMPAMKVICYRSSDKGETWQGPFDTFPPPPFGAHGAVPFRPGSGKRLFLVGTEPTLDPAAVEAEVNTLGIRHSDDDGRTWSEVQLIRPANDPEFLGITAMKPVETARGTWLMGAHTELYINRMTGYLGERVTQQYVLRSTDRGASWNVHACPSPQGSLPGVTSIRHPRCEEGCYAAHPDGRVFSTVRTIEGHVWFTQSEDDGVSWIPAVSTGLSHPSAPAPIFRLDDGRLLVFFHNKQKENRTFWVQSRERLWIALSEDDGKRWERPRFLGQTPRPEQDSGFCYPDLVQDGEDLHIFAKHHFEDTLYGRLTVADLDRLPLKAPPFEKANIAP